MAKTVVFARDEPKQKSTNWAGMEMRKFASVPDPSGGHPLFTLTEYFYETGAEATVKSDDESRSLYVVSGKFEEHLGDDVYVVGPGDGYYIAPGMKHTIRCLESGSYVMGTAKVKG